MTILVQHTFTGANSTTAIPDADTGQITESYGTGTWGIRNNKAYWISGNPSIRAWESNNADVQISVDKIWNSGTARNGAIAFRLSDGSNLLFFRLFTGNLQLYKVVSGTATQIGANVPFTAVNGQTYNFKVIANGTSIKCYVDGVEYFSATDNFNLTSTKHGFRQNAASDEDYDNFLVESLTTSTGVDGSTLFDTKQSIYSDTSIVYDTKQPIYSDLLSNYNTSQTIYSDSFVLLESYQSIYNDNNKTYETAQMIYNDYFYTYDTLQVIQIDGVDGSVKYDLKQSFYKDDSVLINLKQSIYSDGYVNYYVNQDIVDYIIGNSVFNTKQFIYKNSLFENRVVIYIYDVFYKKILLTGVYSPFIEMNVSQNNVTELRGEKSD